MGIIGILDRKFVNAATAAEFISKKMGIPLHELVDVMAAVPKEDVATVVHSKWEINCDGYYPYCKNCGNEPQSRVMTDYCPNCGAKMKEY